MTNSSPVLVVGGTGTTGKRVASQLEMAGHAVRIGSRNSTTPFDWEDRSTWNAALGSADRLYIAYPDLTQEGAANRIAEFLDLAVETGARRAVVLTGRENPILATIEDAVRATAADWTFLRPGWFNQNFSEGFLRPAVMAGEIALPVGKGKEAFVDANDIAAVAVAAMFTDSLIGQAVELSGPQLLGFDEIAATISAASGRSV